MTELRTHNFSLRDWKYNYFTLTDVEMLFPLEMKGFPPVILITSLNNHQILKIVKMEKPDGNKCAFDQIKNQQI